VLDIRQGDCRELLRAALFIGALMFAPAAVLAAWLRGAVLLGCVVALVTIARGR